MNLFRLSAVLLLGALGAFDAAGQVPPIQQSQERSVFNLQSTRGVPISNTNNVPPGSDGRAPDPSSGSTGTPGQFQSHVHFGAVVRTTNTLTGLINAVTLDLP